MSASARLFTLFTGATLACVGAAPLGGQAPQHRAILVSFDGFSEPPMRQYSDSASAPALWNMLRTGACAESARPAFPSVTPVGHATIFTGAYANVTGIAAQHDGKLPLSRTTILDWIDGYSSEPLRAEPIWITAARQGVRVFSHMATQSPGPPGYPDVEEPTSAMARARAAAAATLQRPSIGVVNVYNEKIADASVISSDSTPSRAAAGWRGLSMLGRLTAPPREVTWALGAEGDSLHALFYANDSGSAVVVGARRDVARTVAARYAPTDTSPMRGRPLARFFSAPLRVDLARGRRTFVFFRLFEVSRDLSHYLLFASETRVIHANRDAIAAAYDSVVQGTPGNGSDLLLERGSFGPIAADGGDGTAEFRYLETAELLTRQFMRGTEWGWRAYRPQLALDYLPQPDEALHTWYGYAHPSSPGVNWATRARAAAMLARAYALVDLRLEQYERLAAEVPGTMLFVTGEHGMRPTWARFKPNVLLHDAGLLALDANGSVDLSRTLAAAVDGTWISVNRTTRKNGIVPPDSVGAVLDRAERAIRAARDSTGAPIVTATWRAGTVAADSLGLGPPAGGDLYYALAPGLYPSAVTRPPVVSPMPFPKGEHGFPSVDRDMQPAFCALGGDAVPHRYGVVRSMDIAPTVTDWLGIRPPADARGRSVLAEIRGVAPTAAAPPRTSTARRPRGTLMIVGGGPQPPALVQQFVDLAGGKGRANIVVFAEASADGEMSGQEKAAELRQLGAEARSVWITRAQANSDSVARLLDHATGVWFGGGDQVRLNAVLRDTKTEAAIHARYDAGAVIGGTSAGAAVMSEVMITGDERHPGGDRRDTTTQYMTIARGNIVTDTGFALISNAIVDQHFLRRKRQNRLMSLVIERAPHLAAGIDESTALIVQPNGLWRVAGASAVVVYDARQSDVTSADAHVLGATGMRVHVLPAGSTFDPSTGVAKLP